MLDDAALVGRLRYVLAHGVKEGLVERSAEWPGLTCLAQLLGPARRRFQWFNWTKRWSKRGSEDAAVGEGRFAEEIAEPVELEVAPLPCWEGLGKEERQRAVRGLVDGLPPVGWVVPNRDEPRASSARRAGPRLPHGLRPAPPRASRLPLRPWEP